MDQSTDNVILVNAVHHDLDEMDYCISSIYGILQNGYLKYGSQFDEECMRIGYNLSHMKEIMDGMRKGVADSLL